MDYLRNFLSGHFQNKIWILDIIYVLEAQHGLTSTTPFPLKTTKAIQILKKAQLRSSQAMADPGLA